jgi:hypothetical protein
MIIHRLWFHVVLGFWIVWLLRGFVERSEVFSNGTLDIPVVCFQIWSSL